MKPNLQFLRVFIDRECAARLSRIASQQGRTGQRQYGIILERVAELAMTNPQALQELKLLEPRTATFGAAA